MLEVIYRIYEIADEDTVSKVIENNYCQTWGRARSIELLQECLVCESREQFKEIIKDMYGTNITFRNSRKLKPGDLYCVIIGEHCYNVERYFNKITTKCDCCGAKIETYYGKPICFSDFEVKHRFCNITKYAEKCFCSYRCKEVYERREQHNLKIDEQEELYIEKYMFTEDVAGYVYKITKKNTGEFYVGQTMYAPIFRWGQHLKTERFPISKITDYKFEVIEIVSKNCNILDRERYWIQKLYNEHPNKSLNILCTAELKK